jgi:hypothetical protein
MCRIPGNMTIFTGSAPTLIRKTTRALMCGIQSLGAVFVWQNTVDCPVLCMGYMVEKFRLFLKSRLRTLEMHVKGAGQRFDEA